MNAKAVTVLVTSTSSITRLRFGAMTEKSTRGPRAPSIRAASVSDGSSALIPAR